MSSPYAFVLYADGGCNNLTRKNGYASYAVFQGEEKIAHQERKTYTELETSQEAEYRALLDAMQWMRENAQGKYCRILSDSQLIVMQVNGEWACRSENLRGYYCEAVELFNELKIKLSWTPRAEIVKILGH